MKKIISFMLTSAIFLSSIVVSASNPKDNLSIDSSIKGEERKVIEEFMLTLPPEDRENVVYVDEKGKVYSNKPELKKIRKLTKVDKNKYTDDESGESFATPTEEDSMLMATALTCTGGHGPYRRYYSIKGTTSNPMAWLSANVTLPVSNLDIKDNNSSYHGDTGYIYIGGYPESGLGVDAGFQHSTLNQDWAPFITVNGNQVGFTPRYKEGQTPTIKFSVPSDGNIALTISAVPVGGTSATTVTFARAATGWKKNGVGNTLKRLTTIAQLEGKENLRTGSYNKNVSWTNAKIGIDSFNNHTWSSADTGGSCYYPNDTSIVKVNYLNQSTETVSIILPTN